MNPSGSGGLEEYGPWTMDEMIARKEGMLEKMDDAVDRLEWVEKSAPPRLITPSKPKSRKPSREQQLKQQLGDANRDLWNWIAMRDVRVLVTRQEEAHGLMDLVGLRRPVINHRGESNYSRYERWYDLFLRVARFSVKEHDEFFNANSIDLESFHDTFIKAIPSAEGKFVDKVGAKRLAEAIDAITKSANNAFHFNTASGVPIEQKAIKLYTNYSRDESFAVCALCKLYNLPLEIFNERDKL